MEDIIPFAIMVLTIVLSIALAIVTALIGKRIIENMSKQQTKVNDMNEQPVKYQVNPNTPPASNPPPPVDPRPRAQSPEPVYQQPHQREHLHQPPQTIPPTPVHQPSTTQGPEPKAQSQELTPEQRRDLAASFWKANATDLFFIFQEFIKAGFTRQEALELVKFTLDRLPK